jgi:hypothetical protein
MLKNFIAEFTTNYLSNAQLWRKRDCLKEILLSLTHEK